MDFRETDLALCLAQIIKEHPELIELLKAWPELPEQVKTTIKALV